MLVRFLRSSCTFSGAFPVFTLTSSAQIVALLRPRVLMEPLNVLTTPSMQPIVFKCWFMNDLQMIREAARMGVTKNSTLKCGLPGLKRIATTPSRLRSLRLASPSLEIAVCVFKGWHKPCEACRDGQSLFQPLCQVWHESRTYHGALSIWAQKRGNLLLLDLVSSRFLLLLIVEEP